MKNRKHLAVVVVAAQQATPAAGKSKTENLKKKTYFDEEHMRYLLRTLLIISDLISSLTLKL